MDQATRSQMRSVGGLSGDSLSRQSRHSSSLRMPCAYHPSRSRLKIQLTHRAKKELVKLSSLGHFLKGSSAALGIIKVQDACEKIQHYGNKRDEEAGEDLTEPEALKRISDQFLICIKEYRLGKAYLQGLYEEDEEDDE